MLHIIKDYVVSDSKATIYEIQISQLHAKENLRRNRLVWRSSISCSWINSSVDIMEETCVAQYTHKLIKEGPTS